MNKMRTKLATSKYISIVRLLPSEAAMKQNILRASFQTKILTALHIFKPPIPSL